MKHSISRGVAKMALEILKLMEKKNIAPYHADRITKLIDTIERLYKLPAKLQGTISGFIFFFLFTSFRATFEDKTIYFYIAGALVCSIVSAVLGWLLIKATFSYPMNRAMEKLRHLVYPYSSLYAVFMEYFVSHRKGQISFQELEKRNRIIFEPRTLKPTPK